MEKEEKVEVAEANKPSGSVVSMCNYMCVQFGVHYAFSLFTDIAFAHY